MAARKLTTPATVLPTYIDNTWCINTNGTLYSKTSARSSQDGVDVPPLVRLGTVKGVGWMSNLNPKGAGKKYSNLCKITVETNEYEQSQDLDGSPVKAVKCYYVQENMLSDFAMDTAIQEHCSNTWESHQQVLKAYSETLKPVGRGKTRADKGQWLKNVLQSDLLLTAEKRPSGQKPSSSNDSSVPKSLNFENVGTTAQLANSSRSHQGIHPVPPPPPPQPLLPVVQPQHQPLPPQPAESSDEDDEDDVIPSTMPQGTLLYLFCVLEKFISVYDLV